jgi:hypothetical protein
MENSPIRRSETFGIEKGEDEIAAEQNRDGEAEDRFEHFRLLRRG